MSHTTKVLTSQGPLSGRTLKILMPILFAAIFFVIPAPIGLEAQAWKLFGIFAGTILMLMLQGLPEPSAIIVGVTAAGLIVVPIKDVLVGYTDTTVWLIVVAVMLSLGFKKSGLAKRFGLLLIKSFGESSLGLGYVIGVIDLMLAPVIPSAPARGGGLVYPLAQGIFEVVGSKPNENPRRLGAYLTVLLYMMDMVAGSLFMTGMGANLLTIKFASQILEVKVSWGLWTLAAVPGFIVLMLVPYIVYKMYPPELKSVEEVREMAREQLKTLGSITKRELIVGVTFLLSLVLWSTSSKTQIDTTIVAFLGVTIMLLTDVIQWKDIADSKETWGILIWFGGIIGLSSALDKFGFFKWLTVVMKDILPAQGIGTFTTFVIIALLAVIPHYVFPSLVGYIATFAPVIFSFVAVTGAPRYPATFLVAFLMVISSTLTHYGNGLGPLLMGTGYVEKTAWWKIGFIVTLLATVVYLTLGLAYWKVIGLW